MNPVPFAAVVGLPKARAVPSGVLPGPFVRPEIRMYSTAASTTAIATSKIVAMIGDTPRLPFFLHRRGLVVHWFIRCFLRGMLTHPTGECEGPHPLLEPSYAVLVTNRAAVRQHTNAHSSVLHRERLADLDATPVPPLDRPGG